MSSEVAESLREIASNLLAAANRLDGIDVSADAMRSGTATPVVLSRQTCFTCGESMIPGPDGMWWHGDSRDCAVAVAMSNGTVFVPAGFTLHANDAGNGFDLTCARCSNSWTVRNLTAPWGQEFINRVTAGHDESNHPERAPVRVDNGDGTSTYRFGGQGAARFPDPMVELAAWDRAVAVPVTGGTVRVDNGDGVVTYQYNAMLSVPSGFAVGADRDGTVGMRCLLGGWCSWEYEPEDNELTTEQFAQQATAHVAEKHSPGA